MSLHLHRATRADALADGLGRLLSAPLPDPFAGELVVVPARGMERWLSQRLSHVLGAGPTGDGVCAAVDFRSPGSLVAELSLTRGEEDPWSPDALAWPLLDVIDGCLDEPWAATLARHLGHGQSGDEADLRLGRRFSVARRLAGLFASYAGQRPSLVDDWSAGRDTDGAGRALDHDLSWQPELWRRLVRRVGAPSPTERHRQTVELLREDPEAFDLPVRLSLFGHTRISLTEVELLAALAAQRDVHIWLPHPSPVLWSRLAGRVGAVERAADDSHRLVRHPLLSTLGRDTRELERALAAGDPASDAEESAPSPPDTLLGWLQADLAADEARPGVRTLAPDDRSVQVHACHGVARQVDVLREVLLGLLADDPTLEPRDVLVMCPDIDTYAPLIEAGFGLGEVVGEGGHPAHRLRVRLADRSPVQTNPLLAIARALLDVAGGRAQATQVLDLARAEPVRRRFGFSDDDLEQLDIWARESGVRWAFDAEHRTGFGLASYVANTWEFGLDRLLTGVALSDDSSAWLARALPLDDVGSAQVDLVGRLAEYVDRLRAVTDRLTGTHPLDHWLAALDEGVAALTAVSSLDAWQPGQVQRELGRVRRAAAGLGSIELRLPDVRALLSDRLAGRPTRANFRTGTLTVCTMVPMRSVPHRVVCLLGLDDGVFPRQGSVDGDDVLARHPLTGERDARSEDRQLLLDAILAATQTLVITYTGANEFSGHQRPPAVPLKELLDALDLTAVTRDGVAVSTAVTLCHPLQPFDPANVSPGELVAGETFSFDAAAAAGARAAAGPRRPPTPFLDAPLGARSSGDVLLADLLRFWGDPVKGFLGRDGVDLALPADEDQPEDALPVEIDNLAQWAVGDRVLTDLLAGLEPEVVKQREWRRGELPPGQLGWRMLGQILERARPLVGAAAELRTTSPRAVDVAVDLGGGRRLVGTVPQVYADRLVPVTYSRLGAKHRLTSWVQLLALAASDDDHNWTAHTLGRPHSRSRDSVATSLLGPLDHTALDVLADLVALRDHGLRAPLPVPLKASLGYVRARRTRADVPDALVKAGYDWKDGRFPGEQSDPAVQKIWGRLDEPPEVRAAPLPGEEFAGETGRFGALAMRVWSPLVEAEQGELVTVPMESFDLIGPLPTGTTLLEASAGTGKTFTVAALVARYVAEEGVPLDQLLVITFGRAASQELRERVRDQLVAAERALADPASADPDDPLLARLLERDVELRHERLRDALASFDAATIATTHQFCQTVLRSLGVAGDTDLGATLVESLDDLVVEVVDDVYLRMFGGLATDPPFGRETALSLARTVVGDAHAALAGAAGPRVAFAHEVRDEVDRRKRRLGVLSYDDLLGRLADALGDDDAPARERMRRRWQIVLVDEFQDTDPKQWEVLDRAFTGHATMVLIGDPKQAIYAFRGGDVVTYLAAAATATTQATLDTNFRSDADLVARLQVVLRGAALGDPQIVVRDVRASHQGSRLVGAPSPASFRVRQVERRGFRLARGLVRADDARRHIAADCAGDIAALLASDATWAGDPIAARHVAVLVAEWSHAELVREELAKRGIPAVVGGGTKLLSSPAGDEWLTLLEALEQPHRSGRVRAAALTSFVGLTLSELDRGGDEATDQLADRLRGWALLLRGRGVAALFEAAEERGLTARVLATVGGERLLTDLRHLAQTLHETARRDSLGLTGLLEWLRTERANAASERVRRLDSDAAAVQITTVHQSKGLQYPVVHLPFASMRFVRSVDVARYHDDDGTRTVDVSGSGPGWVDHERAHLGEEAGEELRDLYVALTRAQSQVVTWWAPTRNTPDGGLHRLLLGRRPDQAEVPDTREVKDDAYVTRVLGLLSELGGPTAELSAVAGETPPVARAPAGDLTARVFDRSVDTEWRRTSYSGLIRVQEQPVGVTSETETEPTDDESDDADVSVRPSSAEPGTPSPMADLPSGADFGSLVHGVLEHADPEAPELRTELLEHVREQLQWWPVVAGADEIAEGLLPSQHTPMGPLAAGLSLAEIPLRDRLRELDFEFPLTGGDRPAAVRAGVRLGDVAGLLREHLRDDDPLATYADLLVGPLGEQALRGYLSGSIDVVLRVPGDRYVVVDYKTNLLGEPGRPLTSVDYGRVELAGAMLHSHYPLQALLYSVVLHRFLRWRLPAYAPERHLGGVLYLFLRGMCGPQTPVVDDHVAGVFDWSPPAALVTDLSDLLEGARVTAQ